MYDRFLEVENKYIEMANMVLSSIRSEYDSINIIVEGPTLNIFDIDNYTSEILLTFYQNNDLIDQLEFFVYKKGIEETSLEKTRLWLVETLNGILKENKK